MSRWLWGGGVAAVYAFSFGLPVCLDLDGHEAFRAAARVGLSCWDGGAVRGEMVGWLPNPLVWAGLVLLVSGHGRAAAWAGVAALCAATSWLAVGGLMLGYYVWLGSMVVLLAGGVWVATGPGEEEIL